MKSITVLKLRVTDATDAALSEIAKLCRVGRNAGLEDWLLRQRGKPESTAQSTRKCKSAKGGDAPKSESTKIYHAIRSAVPTLGTTQASMLASAIASNLGAKLDWRAGSGENGKRPRRRDAILSYDHRPPFFCGGEIPLHNAHTRLTWTDGALTITIHRPSSDVQDLVVAISLRDLPPGKQKLLHELADKTRKLADSKLVDKDGKWYWHLPLVFESVVRSDVEATLYPTIGAEKNGRQTDRPFRLELPGRTWSVGDGRYLLVQTERLITLRKMIGKRYRDRMGAGHGQKKIDVAVSKRRKAEWDVRTEVRRRAIADVVRQCMRAKCGVLIYREPSLPLRDRCWFKAVGVDWDWTRFGSDLANTAARQGIEVRVHQWKWKDAIPTKETADAAAKKAV